MYGKIKKSQRMVITNGAQIYVKIKEWLSGEMWGV